MTPCSHLQRVEEEGQRARARGERSWLDRAAARSRDRQRTARAGRLEVREEGVTHPKRRPASDWKRQRATTKTGARSLVGTSSTSSCGWNVDGARDVGAEPGAAFLSEVARDGAAEPARVVVLDAGAEGSFSMAGRGEEVGERGRERFSKRGSRKKGGLDGGEMVPHSVGAERRGTCG